MREKTHTHGFVFAEIMSMLVGLVLAIEMEMKWSRDLNSGKGVYICLNCKGIIYESTLAVIGQNASTTSLPN